MTKKVPIGSLRTPEEIRRSLLGLYGSLTSTDASVEANEVSIGAIEVVNAQLVADLDNAEIAVAAAEAEILLKLPIGDAAADVNAHAVTIDGGKLTADSVTANEIAANAITSNELAANSVIAGKILANTIVAGDIAANTITSAEITAGTITGVEMNAATSITVGTHATNKWVIDGTASATTTAIHTANATDYGDVDGVWFGADGRISMKDKLTFNGTTLTVNGAVNATSFNLIQGALTVFSAYSSDTSFERLRMYTNDSVINENWDIGWSSGDYDEFDTNTLFIKLNAPGNPTPTQVAQSLGITMTTSNLGGDQITQYASGNDLNGYSSTMVAGDQNSLTFSRSGGNIGTLSFNGFGTGKVNASVYANGKVDIEGGEGVNFVSSTGSPTIKIGEWSSGYNCATIETDTGYLILGSGLGADESAYLRTKGSGALYLGTNGTNKLTIANGGNVGIGTTSPGEELHILKDQDGDLTQILIENLDQRVRIGSYYEAGVGQYAKIQAEQDAGGNTALTLNPEGGNVGIGTTYPSKKLDVAGNIGGTEIYATNWFRSHGDSGWYNETYGCGLRSTQAGWIRTYGGGIIADATVLLAAPLNHPNSSGSLEIRRETIYGTIVTIGSNREMKENVQSIDPAESGRIIDMLRPVTYIAKYRSGPDGSFVEGIPDTTAETDDQYKLREWDVEYGFIAEEIDALEPEGVKLAVYDWQKIDEEGFPKPAGWKGTNITAILVAEVKELRKRLAVLEAGQ